MTAKLRGEVVDMELSAVEPNDWNPNKMTKHTRASLKHGLETVGWLRSQALLVWGSDEDGVAKGSIIDGEHRWTVARELGFTHGPMVVLNGLPEREAKSLTIQMNTKRGEAHIDLMTELLQEIREDSSNTDLALETGFNTDYLDAMLAKDRLTFDETLGTMPTDPVFPPDANTGERVRSPNTTDSNGLTQMAFTITVAQKAVLLKALTIYAQDGGPELKPSDALMRMCEETIVYYGDPDD